MEANLKALEIEDDCGKSSVAPQQGHHPLDVARYTSQTCRLWRNLVIQSSSIWANVIDLRVLLPASDERRKEVIDRSSNSPLAVRGMFAAGNEGMCRFFLSLLNNNWDRFRSIHVYIDHEWPFQTGALDIIYKPAPELESFSLQSGCFDDASCAAYVQLTSKPLFSGHAPKLQQFRCSNILFNLDAPWTRHLRMISFSFGVNTSQVISALPHMSLLESLELRNAVVFKPNESSHQVPLRRLQRIYAECFLDTCLAVLASIEPPPGCGLYLMLQDSHPEACDIPEVTRVLTKYAECYFNSTEVTSISVDSCFQEIYVATEPLRQSRELSLGFLAVVSADLFMTPGIHAAFFKSFSSCDFSKVTRFKFYEHKQVEATEPTLGSLFALLDSVETLQIFNELTLQLLSRISIAGRPPFPSLKILVIVAFDWHAPPVADSFATKVLRFITHRRQHFTAPLEVLDLTGFEFHDPQDLSDFEALDGLTVLSKRKGVVSAYRCGSGNSNLLQI
ncbi:hypothetical protein M413DRAFT_28561 [Hebeloma cylindrosporum]|uniref:F-box domain-containing protein n=1 Tax=Hebeloma cylindrosporum TaxID=76867 RepID=A0A0C3CB26_HEBCY|nr:hypothetical protein M413DRAFT_28561 [Hebeloma cylindrosporum h7]